MASNTPKTMSSRLATMKFMQRSVAKSEPSTPDERPSKRARLSNGASVPSTPDQQVLQSALAAEEKKREEVLARAFEKSGETKWVLSFHDPQKGSREPAMEVRHAGFADLDAEDSSEEDDEDRPLRMQFGGGVKKKQAMPPTPIKSEDAETKSDSDLSSDELSSDDPTAALIRETKREVAAKERNARNAPRRVAEETPKRPAAPLDEDMDLGGLTSLSGGGRGGSGARSSSNIECFKCGQKGHMSKQCPNAFAARGSAGRGRGRGRGRK